MLFDWTSWLPALTSSATLAAAGVVAGIFYRAQVERGIQYRFDKQLEELKSRHRRDEDSIKNELKTRDEQISLLRAGALSGLAGRQAELAKRRLRAVELLWAETVELGKLKFLCQMTSTLKIDEMIDRASRSGSEANGIKKFVEMMLDSAGQATLTMSNLPDKERPFVDPIAWALFSAYRQMLLNGVVQLNLVKSGLGKDLIKEPDIIIQPIKSALPEYAKFLDEFGWSGVQHVIQPLEEKLLTSLSQSLEGNSADEAAITRAAAIIKEVDKTAAAMSLAAHGADIPSVS